jgi:glycosyltransferase involved in cell wall biosynthesis
MTDQGAGEPESMRSQTVAGSVPTVSVVVATRDRGPLLDTLFDALARQEQAPAFEVVVVDDGSTDDTWDQLREQVHTSAIALTVLRHPTNRGQGPARNLGVAHARGEVVAFTDDDCRPESGWLADLTGPLLAAASNVRLVAQGRTRADDLDAGPWSRSIWIDRPTWLFETCNVAYRRVDFVEAGGFPGAEEAIAEANGRLIGEDAILGWRVMAGGASLLFRPNAVVAHRSSPASYRDYLRQCANRGVFCRLLRGHPEGRRALWGRIFLARRTAAFELAVAAVVATVVSMQWWVFVRLVQIGLCDAVSVGALMVGSARYRCLVL